MAPAARTLETISAHGVDRAEHVGDVREGDQAHIAAPELCVEFLQRELALLIDLQVAELGAALAAEHLPGNDVRVVLHLGDQHGVARAHVRPAPGVGDEVDRLGHVLGEDRRLRLCVGEGGDARARTLERGVGLGGSA